MKNLNLETFTVSYDRYSKTVEAVDSEDAAEKFVEEYDQEDMRIAADESYVSGVMVTDSKGNSQFFNVRGAIRAYYYADRVV